jgi:opacity protein-like surface antigen
MRKRLLVVVLVVSLLSSAVMALDPMGPPTAGLTQGQWSAGLDYAFSETDLDFDGKFDMYIGGSSIYPGSFSDKLTFEAVEMHKGYLNIGYGIRDNWEVFFRLGGARAEAQKPTRDIYKEFYEDSTYMGDIWIGETGPCHDFDTGYAIGFGTKVTIYEDRKLRVGALGQASYTEMDIRVKYEGLVENDNAYVGTIDGIWSVPSEGELELWEIQLAIGAAYDLSERFTVYGGPFFHWMEGDYDFKGKGYFMEPYIVVDELFYDYYPLQVCGSYDVEADSEFGGYLGAQIDVTENVACNAECMLTGDAIGVGTSLIWRFD